MQFVCDAIALCEASLHPASVDKQIVIRVQAIVAPIWSHPSKTGGVYARNRAAMDIRRSRLPLSASWRR